MIVDVPCPACGHYFEYETEEEQDVPCSCPKCGYSFSFDVDYDPVAGIGVEIKK